MHLPRPWRSTGVFAIVALLVGGVAFAATRADGRTGSQSVTNDGGAWLLNREAGAVGHLNREVLEVSAGVRVAEAGSDFDVDQSADVIVLHDRSTSTAMLLDGRTNQMGAALAVPNGAVVKATTGGIVVHQNDPLTVWQLSTDELAAIDDVGDLPPTFTGGTGLVTVGADSTFVYDESTATVSHLEHGAEVERLAIDGEPAALTIANGRVIAAVDNDLIDVGSGQSHSPGVGPYTLAQPTKDQSIVAVDAELNVFVISPDGATASFALATPTSDPIVHDGCVFAIVEPATLVRHCGETETLMPLDGASGELRLRLVNGWIWVNDLDSGGAWVTNAEATLSRIDDWGTALAEESTDESDATVEDEGGIEEVRLNPDADDVQVIDADQRDDDDENDPPVARDDSATTRVDRPVVVRVLDNDEDPDGDVLLVESIELIDTNSAQVWITNARDSVQVTPAAGFEGTIEFSYVVTDGRGGSDRAIVKVEVTTPSAETNRPPEPVTDIATVRAGSTTSLNVLTNDTDPDGDALVLLALTADLGTVAFDPSGQISFTPDTNDEQGRVEATYVVADDFGATAEGRVIINVRLADANSVPDARNDSIVTSVGNPARVNVLDNDTDPDGDPLIVARQPVLTAGPNGVTNDTIAALVQVTSDGEFTFEPEVAGVYVFEYLASDGQGSDTAQIRVDVTDDGVNLPPVAVRDDVSIPVGGTRLVYALDNDGDPNGDVIDIVEWSGTQGLTIEPVSGIGFRVTVETDAPQRATFRYAISDGTNEPVATVVVVSVADVASTNQPPIVRPDSVELRPGRSTTVQVLLNDFDPEGGSLSVIRLPESTADATYELGPDGQSIVVTLAPTASTGFSFGYDVTDSGGATAASTVDVRVISPTEPNRPPTPRPDVARTLQAAPITIDVLANDSDPDGDVITIESIASQPRNGVVEIIDGTISYAPSPTFTGTDRFAYVIIDTEGARSIGNVQVGVTPSPSENRAPSANNDRIVVTSPSVLDIFANDHDPDGDTLSLVSFTEPSVGTLTRAGSVLRFTPPTITEPTEVSFSYEITDGHGNTDSATVVVIIEPAPEPQPPTASDDTAGPLRGNREIVVDVLANDHDPDGETSDLTISTTDPSATVTGTSLSIAVGIESTQVRYRITDADGLSDTATVTVLVVDNEAPIITPLRTETGHETPVRLSLGAQVSDPDNDEIYFACCDNVIGGSADVVTSNGGQLEVVFTPSVGFSGAASFAYSADDQAGHLVSGSVTIAVEPPDNRAPVASSGNLTIEAGDTLPYDLASLVDDPDDDKLTFSLDSSPLSANLSGSRVSLTAPVDGAGQTERLVFSATDPSGESTQGSLDITITQVTAAPPQALADEATTNQDTAVSIRPLANDLDPLGDGLTIFAVGSTPEGTTTVEGDSVVFTPNPDVFGTISFNYTIRDAAATSDRESVGQVTVEVIGRPGSPATPAANADNATATVTWAAPAPNGAPIDAYRIDYRTPNSTTSFDLGVQNSHTFTGLTNDLDYEFRVQARNSAGWGDWSPWSSAVRPNTTPDRPAAPTATFANAELAVTWAAPPNEGSPITGYQIEIGGGANQVVAVGSSPYVWSGLTNGTEYQFRVAAINDAGMSDWSTWSTSEHPLTAPASPAAPTVSRGNQYLDIDWSAPQNNGDPVSGYEIQIQGTDQIVPIAGASTTDHRWADLANGVAQQFRVRASNRDPSPGAWSAWSSPVVPCAVPDTVAAPAAVRGDGQASITWTTPSDQGCALTGYEIRANGSTIQTTGVTNAHTFTGLTNGTSYNFEVRAINEEGAGAWSSSSAAIIPAGPPTTPTISSVTPTAEGELTATWQGASANGSPITRHEVSINGGNAISVNGSSHVITDLANSTSYGVRIRACNVVGCSNYSGTVSATTMGPPSNPVGFSVAAGETTAFASWSTPASDGDNAIISYWLYVFDGGAYSYGPDGRSQEITGLASNTNYRASISVCNRIGCSSGAEFYFTTS